LSLKDLLYIKSKVINSYESAEIDIQYSPEFEHDMIFNNLNQIIKAIELLFTKSGIKTDNKDQLQPQK